MHRFYDQHLPTIGDDASAAAKLSGLQVELSPTESRHARVLRLKVGDAVELFDGRGLIAQGRVAAAGRGEAVTVDIESARRVGPPAPRLDVAVAIPKGPRGDAMIEQLSQAGADRLIPLRTQRSVVHPRDTKVQKMARTAVESAKQCGRAYVMAVEPPTDLAAVLQRPYDLRLIAQPGSDVPADLPARLSRAAGVLVVIGPEGGWSPPELALCAEHGCLAWRLGPHVLRIETAAVAAATLVRYLTAAADGQRVQG
jgi:16S rRNA (uracil1498-N3)-methyltransferase